MDYFRNWKEVKGRAIYKLINSDRNREPLEDVPHRRILDLAIFLFTEGEIFYDQEQYKHDN